MPVMKELALIGTSPVGWHEAAQEAVRTAAITVRHIEEVEVVRLSAAVTDGAITEYRAELKVAFRLER